MGDNQLKKISQELEPVNRWITFLVLLIGMVVGFHLYIDKLILDKVSNPETIELIKSKIRPYIIFDSENRIISGKSALRTLVNKIEVIKDGTKVVKINLETKELLSSPPVLECLDANFRIDEEKGAGLKWMYSLHEINSLNFQDSAKPKSVLRFKFEFME